MTDRQKRRLFLIVLAIGGALTLLGTWYLAPGLFADFT